MSDFSRRTKQGDSLVSAREALRCLALEVPAEVWDDANAKIGGALDRMEAALHEIAAMADARFHNDVLGEVQRSQAEAAAQVAQEALDA